MSYCINPNCPQPQNSGQPLFCQACGSELLLEGCYRVLRPLGGGGFGKTYEVDDAGTKKVLKVLFNTVPKAVELFQQEAEVLKRLNHPGIPKVESDGYFIYFPRDAKEPLHCLVMEKIEGMNLEEYITQRNNQAISDRAAIRWLKQITEILHQVHQKNYFHRDIKPPNIMIRPNGQLVLIDFGTAREVTQTLMQKVAGQQVTGIISAGYTPPEQMNGKAVPQSDFFALGRTFVYLLTGKYPQNFAEDSRTGALIWRDNAAGISQKLLDLVDYLMSPFPGNRPKDTQEILYRLAKFETSSPEFKTSNSYNQSSNYGPYAKTVVSTSGKVNQVVSSPKYASPWIRFLAYFIDLIICCIFMPLSIAFLGSIIIIVMIPDQNCGTNGICSDLWYSISLVLSVIFTWLHFAVAESSVKQSTYGQGICKIVVINMNGKRISLWRATWRFIVKILLTFLTFGLGDIIFMLFNEKNRSLHDILAGTVVIKKPSP
ncbi:RDD family protein [Aphanizomenon flos-aquae FACHB-1416]|uniref:non-specific serine/threonine protein kinase n=2 Tax=Aphanizomenonaceae TaxID=1892259 RepID=A0ABR8IN35_APHFL|nr:RDD family protein [Aphanizomenon flos-aquae FACHB-1171]MBD2555940.1 RDD family protein [Aphanizomenon flos-aquae FACHB-1290]MBD2633320.1 RDD family protein [Aphanizomenon sp. FACHB-1399]MBD2644224.1 RDD family protein [Aphanizomenon sp. FACHB-1401]MBD2656527.1 RDD family protein [Aphanizomenon flos-aquae FACHB-1265]MBD2674365.1 RDD family protein [Aphanizomenon flos-aquae FACHB-1416]MBD2684322.1 RDD family protein [Aphanizomenon flos-aquae FACHB-1249]MBD2696919.1 RDD family protein [Apha